MYNETLLRGHRQGIEQVLQEIQLSAEGRTQVSVAVPGPSTALLVNFTLDVSACKMLFITSDLPVVIKTNSSGSPVNIFTLAAGSPFSWHPGDGALRDTSGTAVVTDVTALYIVNADEAVAANVVINALYDSTP